MKAVVDWFDLTGDMTKTRQYKENYQRAKYKEEFTDIEDYLKSLNMVLSVKLNSEEDIPRISELTQKTNQFNLTTKRYSEEDIRNAMAFCRIYSLSVKDKFGDSGLTGLCIVRGGRIDAFLLSCRILGRNIEYSFIDYVIKDLKVNHYEAIVATHIPSKKNAQTRDFYSNAGFKCITASKEQFVFTMIFSNYNVLAPNYFRYE
jgi:FkbH-like protein